MNEAIVCGISTTFLMHLLYFFMLQIYRLVCTLAYFLLHLSFPTFFCDDDE